MTRHGGSVQKAPSFEILAGKQQLPEPPYITVMDSFKKSSGAASAVAVPAQDRLGQ
jgi:hypothetical protein